MFPYCGTDVTLRININDKDGKAAFGESTRQIDGGRCFTNTSFLSSNGDNFRTFGARCPNELVLIEFERWMRGAGHELVP